MNIEFHYRTYSYFGGNATLNLASQWLGSRLRDSYGGHINSVVVEFCAKNVSPPKKTLESNHEQFELFLTELPIAGFQEKGTELRICTRLVKHYHDEIKRDSQVLSLKVFNNTLNKSIQLLNSASELASDLKGFDNFAMSKDIENLVENSPKTLVELCEEYIGKQNI